MNILTTEQISQLLSTQGFDGLCEKENMRNVCLVHSESFGSPEDMTRLEFSVYSDVYSEKFYSVLSVAKSLLLDKSFALAEIVSSLIGESVLDNPPENKEHLRPAPKQYPLLVGDEVDKWISA